MYIYIYVYNICILIYIYRCKYICMYVYMYVWLKCSSIMVNMPHMQYAKTVKGPISTCKSAQIASSYTYFLWVKGGSSSSHLVSRLASPQL